MNSIPRTPEDRRLAVREEKRLAVCQEASASDGPQHGGLSMALEAKEAVTLDPSIQSGAGGFVSCSTTRRRRRPSRGRELLDAYWDEHPPGHS